MLGETRPGNVALRRQAPVHESTYRTHVNHPPDVVSSFLADLCNDKEWRREVVETRLLSDVAGREGARYREIQTWEGLRAPADLTVVRLERGSRLTVLAEDPGYRATCEYEFEKMGDGTDLKLTSTIETTGTLQLVEPFLSAIVTRWIERGLDSLGRVLDERGNISK